MRQARPEALDPRIVRRLGWLGQLSVGCAAAGYSVSVQAGHRMVYPWSITVREGRLGTLELGEAITFVCGVVMLAAVSPLGALQRSRGRVRPAIRTPLIVALVSGLLGSAPSVTSLGAHLIRGATTGMDLFVLFGGVFLLMAAGASGLALIAWQRDIGEYERSRTRAPRPAPAEVRRRLLVVRSIAIAVLLLIGWWGLGPWGAIEANERAAERVVDDFSSAQMHFRQATVVDQDGDGFGEYAFLDELAGIAPPRGSKGSLRAWRQFPRDFEPTAVPGVWERRGYLFVVYLPSSLGRAITAPQRPGAAVAADGPFQRETAVLYAWPMESGGTGGKAYFATEGHCEWVTVMQKTRYSGLAQRPEPYAALSDSKGSYSIPGVMSYDTPVLANLNGVPADDTEGLTAADGNRWVRWLR